MGRVTVGYQDACVYPLWLSRLNTRLARLMGATAVWLPDHFMGFTPADVWRPEVTPAARVVPSIDALFDPIAIAALLAVRVRRLDIGTSVTESIRRHPMSLAQSFVTLDHLSKGRAILGIGNGIRENTEPYGLPYAHNVERLEEALTIIRLLWDSGGTPVSFEAASGGCATRYSPCRCIADGRRVSSSPHTIRACCGSPGASPTAGCRARRSPPTSTPGGSASSADRRRAPGRRPSPSRRRRPCWSPSVTAASKSSRPPCAASVRSMALGAPAAVWREHGLTHPLGETHAGFLDLVPSRVTTAQVDQAAATMTPTLLLTIMYAGSPQEICAEAAPLAAAGCTHFILANAGASFMGDGAKGLWRLGNLIRQPPCANERERGGDPNLVYEGTEEGERGGSEGEGWRGIRKRARNGRSP